MISIIIPFYNTEKYIRECLDSIKNQTFSDYECLMIDDGSTDNSRKIAEEYLNDPRFKILGDKHIGFPLSKNLGLDNAKGDYITFIDSDDFIEKDYLSILYGNLINTNSDISSCNYNSSMCFYDKEQKSNLRVSNIKDNIIRELLRDSHLWNKLYKREIFDHMRFEDVEALSDTMLTYLLYEKANQVVYSNYLGYHYRVHNENMTYRVRNFSSTYWPHRLNVYLTMCYYLYTKYSSLQKDVKSKFRRQYQFCLPHLTKEQIEEFNKEDNVKILLH